MSVRLNNTFKGLEWEEGVAKFDPVQDKLEREALKMYAKAQRLRQDHVSQDHADIDYARGDIDRYIILADTRGLHAAMSIEYGRGPGDTPGDPFPNGTRGTFILHRATGAPIKNVRPNSRRRKTLRR